MLTLSLCSPRVTKPQITDLVLIRDKKWTLIQLAFEQNSVKLYISIIHAATR